jgi:hypothetical protein
MPCTALLFVAAHPSLGNNFFSNLTKINEQTRDAKCNETYQPMIT